MSNKISRRGFLGLVAAGAVASVGVLAACGKTNSTNEAANTSEATGDTQRVVALNTGQLDNLLMLGIVPVGVAAAKGAELIPQFIKDKFGSQYDLDGIANCGLRQTPNVEAISKLEPTLICANERTDEEILTKLRDIAPVMTGKGGGENWKDDLATIAEAVGKKDEAKKLLDAYLADAADFKGKLPAEVPTVSFLRTKDDAFQVYGTNSMAGTVAADCGLARPESQQFTNKAGKDLSAEVLDQADADWIFYGVQSGAPSPADTPLWPSLKAVTDNHAVEVDYESWYLNASLLSAQIILEGLGKVLS